MMHTLPIRNPLAIAYNTGILAEYMGGSHVPAPQPVAPSRSYNTGFVPEYQGGSHVPDPALSGRVTSASRTPHNTGFVPEYQGGSHVPDAAFGQAVAGSSQLGTTPA